MKCRISAFSILVAFWGCTHFDSASDVEVGNLGTNPGQPMPEPPVIDPPDPTSGGFEPPASLVSRSLMARYMINEDTSGSDTTFVRDFANTPIDVEVKYDSPDDQFVEINGHRGIQFTDPSTEHGLYTPSNDNKFEQRIQNASSFTFETVVDIQDNTNRSRLMYLGRKNEFGLLMISTPTDTGSIAMGWKNGERLAQWPVDYKSLGRMVLTFVIDLENSNRNLRVRLYLNGVFVEPTGIADIPDGQVLDYLGEDETELVFANKADQSAGLEAILYYAALYSTALTNEEVSLNASRLLSDDDTP